MVYHHTHWDREWWATFQDFRIRLVELIDELLEVLDVDADFSCFLLDGQTIVLKDYLEVRPENRERLVRYIREGRVQCGPWHILPDEFLVSGEAHVRNLWLGRKTADELGYRNIEVGYIPDTFGHISQMPQILSGFGIDNAIVWRGRGGPADTGKQEFNWEAPDGSCVLAFWFPDGYYVMDFFHFEDPVRTYEETYGKVRRSLERWAERATTEYLLMPYGGDHRLIDRRLHRILRDVSEDLKDFGEISWSSTPEFIKAVRERNPRLDTVRGELRAYGVDFPHVLPGVLSARLYLKQLNFQGQLWLERYAEPFSAMAWRRGRRYDSGLLWKAWEYLVQNHPHDSICGCSIDQVHREMIPRFDQSRQIAQILTEKSVEHLNRSIDTSSLPEGDTALVIHNPLPWTRTDVASVLIDREEVGPRTHVLRHADGSEVPFQARDVGMIRPMRAGWQYTELTFPAKDVPGLGYRAYRLARRETPEDPRDAYFTAVQPSAKRKGSERVTDLSLGDNIIENRHLRVEVSSADGTLTITDRESGESYRGLNAFEDGGDAGDEYNYSTPLNDVALRSDRRAAVHVSVAEAGYARATLRVDLDWSLPVSLADDRLSRCSEYVATRISTFVTLTSEARHVDVRVEWENRSKDHRLRALFPLGSPVSVSHAEGQYDVVGRPVRVTDQGNGWAEPYVPTMPQQGWVSISSEGRGLTIANRGLPEFEVLDDDTGTVALTILRSVGWLSRQDMLSRVGHAGPELPTPDAQCLGPVSAEYSIIPHRADWLSARSYVGAHEYLAPLYGSVTDDHRGDLGTVGGFLELQGDHTLLLSACKKAEHSDALILRFWNVASERTKTTVRLAERPVSVRRVDLQEEPLNGHEVEIAADGSFGLSAGPSEIATIAIQF